MEKRRESERLMGDKDDPANWIDDEGRAVLQ